MVPNQISQFVLFDGELLNEFEELVANEGSNQAKAIKTNIEKALGLPVLQRAYSEIDKLNKVLQKNIANNFKNQMLWIHLLGTLKFNRII